MLLLLLLCFDCFFELFGFSALGGVDFVQLSLEFGDHKAHVFVGSA